MPVQKIQVNDAWQKISNGDTAVVLQNLGYPTIEVASVAPGDTPNIGFVIKYLDSFSYSGTDELWARCRYGDTIVLIDIIGA
jgi:hypothetical protein